MDDLDNIFLFEQSPEALEAVKSGKAYVGPGGIRRKGENGKGFLELSKPSTMSVADLKSLLIKEPVLEINDRLDELDSNLMLSNEGLKELQKIEWLNSNQLNRNYIITYEGFCHTLDGINNIIKHISEFKDYVTQRDVKDLCEKAQTYVNYMRTDSVNMLSEQYNIINGNIAEHLDKISAFIKRLIIEIDSCDNEDVFLQVKILINLITPFAYVVRRYSSLYYYENEGRLMPGNYEEWIGVLSKVSHSSELKNMIEYYIFLKTIMPYKDKISICKEIDNNIKCTVSNVEFEHHYIQSHGKNAYLSLDDLIREKYENKDYFVIDNNMIIFLDKK